MSNERIENNNSHLEVNSRGALVHELTINGNNVIYPFDGNKRGGVPILGPIVGAALKGWKNLYPKLPQHGTHRIADWKEINRDTNSVKYERITSTKKFLFAGRVQVSHSLLDNGLKISLKAENLEDKPREVAHGFHPYFATNGEKVTFKDELFEDMLKGFENKKSIALKNKTNINEVIFTVNDMEITLNTNTPPHQWVIWSDDINKYICVEPFWGDVGSGEILKPREIKEYSLTIQVKK